MTTALWLALLTPIVAAAGLTAYARDYRPPGRTRAGGLTGVLAAFFIPQLALQYAMPFFRSPETPWHVVGYGLMLAGGTGCLLACTTFRSPERVVGTRIDELVTTGPYRYSRNPQYVLYIVFLAGYAFTGSSWMVCIGLALFLAVIHFTILIEEAHLQRVFGDAYAAYTRQVPRYLLV